LRQPRRGHDDEGHPRVARGARGRCDLVGAYARAPVGALGAVVGRAAAAGTDRAVVRRGGGAQSGLPLVHARGQSRAQFHPAPCVSRRRRAARNAAVSRRDAAGISAVVAERALGDRARAAPPMGGRHRATLGSHRALAARGHRLLRARALQVASIRPARLSGAGRALPARSRPAGPLLLGWSAWRRLPGRGAWAALAVTLAFLPMAGDGMATFARTRSARTVTEALVFRLQPGDQVVHEGPLENSGSLLLALDRRVTVVNGRESNLAFGATFPEARDLFWDGTRLAQEWPKPGRRFLVTSITPERSVVRTLPTDSYRLVVQGGGR